ncbi:histidine kinase [Chryseobacterium geocarposphaerae]|uniref:Histidine kinase n=2 Tax=Chryseobacterium geocarposphaerae TaxID=1416776 RepID=A0A2M9CA68_9FLAO|nr:histidine kinase [Chryseobacterium geocarposphaerae]
MDYAVFGNFLFFINFKIFLVFFILFYLNYSVCLPFIIKQKPNTILAFTISFIVIYVGLMIAFFPPLRKPPHFPPPGGFMRPGRMMKFNHDLNFYDIFFKIGLFSIVFSTLLFFVDKWTENGKKIKELEFERQSSELKILREQINPHFFFNALNSIYSLSIVQSKETPRVILILSDIMRYVLSTKNRQKNNLEDEINNIKKYIEIQSIRFKKYNNIHCVFEGNFKAYEIEPLLLLTFVENAFKHADIRKGPLDLFVYMKDDILGFNIKNFYEKKNADTFSSNKMGIKNTKMKLDLIYPEKYQLYINDNGSEYQIKLRLQLN